MDDLQNLLQLLQAGSAPVLAVIAYFLWKLDKQFMALQVTINTLIETMIRFVPGVRKSQD